jgi:hypothetical protein
MDPLLGYGRAGLGVRPRTILEFPTPGIHAKPPARRGHSHIFLYVFARLLDFEAGNLVNQHINAAPGLPA